MRGRIVILAAVVLAALCVGLYFYHYIPDDTYIALRYAHNAIAGKGLVFNPGERVEGYTNFLWLVILIGAGKTGLPLVGSARALSVLFSIGALVMLTLAARKRSDSGEGGEAPFDLLLPSILLAASPPFLTWSMSGSEVPLFTFLLLGGFILAGEATRPCLTFIVFALLGLVRPEGALFYVLAWIALLVRNPHRLRTVAQGFAVAALFYVPYLSWKWHYFHALLPNTFYAKMGPPGLMFDNGTRYVFGFILCYGYLFIIGYYLLRRAGHPAGLAALFVVPYWVASLFLGGDWMPNYRLLLPTLPFVMLVIAAGLRTAAGIEHRKSMPLIAAIVFFLTIVPGAATYDAFTLERTTVTSYARLGKILKEILPPDTSIGCGSAGAIGYYTELPMVDILGLTDAHIARQGQVVAAQPGHLKTDGAYVLSRRPDLLLLGNVWIHQGVREETALVTKVQEKEITRQADFPKLYEYVNLPLGNGFYLSCYKLRGFFLPL
jgi:arabinofuranosyltransferase